jgi:hypothetical protein
MSKPQRTPEGKWAIYHAVTGQQIERWPVDARGMLATGEYVSEPPSKAQALPPVSPEDRGIIERADAVLPRDKRGEGPRQTAHHVPAATSADIGVAEVLIVAGPVAPPVPEHADVTEGDAPPGDRSRLPEGYTTIKRGRFVALTDPEGRAVKSSTRSGKYDGLDAARRAAWAHADGA